MRRQQRLPGALPRKQRGVAMVFTAAFILAAVAALALAIDVGRLYAAQQRLQTAANLAALDAARYVGGCRDLPGNTTLKAIAQKTVNRNFAERNDGAVPITRFDTGSMDTQNDLRHLGTTPARARPSAVALTVTDNDFKPLFINLFGGAGPLQASAGAANEAQAVIGVGSELAGISPSLLGQLLPIDIGAAQQGDLAGVTIPLADLLNISADVATRQQLLSTSINQALTNISDVVSGQVAPLVDQIANLFPANAGQGSLLDILDIAGEVGAQTSVNVGAIVNAAAQLAAIQRNSAITLPVSLNAPLVGGADVKLRLLEPPQIAIGPPGIDPDGSPQDGFPAYYTQVESAQVGLEIRLNLLRINLGLVSANLADLPLAVRGARATVGLRDLECARSTQMYHQASFDTQTEDLRIGIGHFEDTNGNGRLNFVPTTAKILDVKILFLGLIAAQVSADSRIGLESGEIVNFDPVYDPDTDLPQAKPFGSDVDTAYVLNLLSNMHLSTSAVGLPIPIGDILNPIQSALSGPLTTALAPILDPILNQLGVSLGTGDAKLLDLDVDQPQLFCTSNEDCFGSS